jgi:hypothetical protein
MIRTHARRAPITKVAIWVALALVAIVGIDNGLALIQSSPAPNPVEILQEALSVAGAADAFGYHAVWRADGVSQIVVGHARPSSGSESVSVSGDQFSVISTGQIVYFEGDATALRDQLGLAAATASKNAGKWISLQESDGPFLSVDEGLTTSAALAQIVIAPSATSAERRAHGLLLSRITGRIPHGGVVTGSASLDVTSRTKLPVSYSAEGNYGGERWSSTIGFSHWGEKSAVKAPASAIPFSSLHG